MARISSSGRPCGGAVNSGAEQRVHNERRGLHLGRQFKRYRTADRSSIR